MDLVHGTILGAANFGNHRFCYQTWCPDAFCEILDGFPLVGLECLLLFIKFFTILP